MPIRHKVSPDGHFVYAIASGEISADDILQYLDALRMDPVLAGDHVTLLDGRLTTGAAIDESGMNHIIKSAEKDGDRLWASQLALVTQDKEQFETARRYEALALLHNENTVVFNDIGTACTWLGLSEELLTETRPEMTK